jgi:hypothetical protein
MRIALRIAPLDCAVFAPLLAAATAAATASLMAANASRAAGKKFNILLIWGDDNGKRWEVSQNACD